MKYIQIIIFLIVFSSVYFGLNYYALYRLLGFFSITKHIWIPALCLALAYPLIVIIDRYFHSMPTRAMYFLGSSWLGFLFILFCILILTEIVNLFYPVFGQQVFGWIIIGISLFITGFALANASDITIKEVNIDKFGKEMKVVQLSDIHIGTIRNSEFLNRIVDTVNSLEPDIVLITGDLVDGSGKMTNETFRPLKRLNYPAYFIMGNHEFYEGTENVHKLLDKSNVRVLQNEAESRDGINIIGLDYSENKTYVSQQLSKIRFNQKLPSILLTHVPIGYEDAKKQGIDLQLSGHTHDGQIFPFSLIVRLVFPKKSGLYRLGNFSLYVSPGTGTWGPPMRLGSKNEITVLNLN